MFAGTFYFLLMASGKGKINKQIIQLALFEEEQPASTEQIEEGAPAEPAEEAPVKKRGRKKKSLDTPPPDETPQPEELAEFSLPVDPVPAQEEPTLQEPADLSSDPEKETERKEKYRKDQEARLAALWKARGKK